MGKKILLLISLSGKQPLLLLLLIFCANSLYAQGGGSLKLEANVMESACAGNGHVIAVKAQGGQAPYTYHWQDGVAGSFRKDLPSGTYSCTVRDARGAEVRKQFIFKPQAPALAVSHSQQKLANGSNSIAVEVKGGKAPYNYFWIGSGINVEASRGKNRQDGLAEGTYQVVVQDANECSASITVNIQ